MNKWQQCPLFEWCPNHTAACRVCLPDNECYWYRWFEQLIKGNLTMEENPIKITVENYKDQTITFTMPHDIPVSILRGTSSDRFNYLNISVVGGDKYTIEEEQLPD